MRACGVRGFGGAGYRGRNKAQEEQRAGPRVIGEGEGGAGVPGAGL